MLNDQLPVAVTNAANIGPGRLQSAMLEIRREFARQGKEIILLIEDFALIQGIQRDLLDAIIEVGERDGQTVLAPVRTLMAVTTGYYSRLADTVLTRARAATPYVYDLDVQFDASDEGMAETSAFVGRYLNAARLGRDALDSGRTHAPPTTSRMPATAAHYRDECHPAFGNSPQGHGIYPFNQTALRRAIRARPALGQPGRVQSAGSHRRSGAQRPRRARPVPAQTVPSPTATSARSTRPQKTSGRCHRPSATPLKPSTRSTLTVARPSWNSGETRRPARSISPRSCTRRSTSASLTWSDR